MKYFTKPKLVGMTLLLAISLFAVIAYAVDTLNGDGSFNTTTQYNNWTKEQTGVTISRDTATTYNGTAGSALINANVGKNALFNGKIAHAFTLTSTPSTLTLTLAFNKAVSATPKTFNLNWYIFNSNNAQVGSGLINSTLGNVSWTTANISLTSLNLVAGTYTLKLEADGQALAQGGVFDARFDEVMIDAVSAGDTTVPNWPGNNTLTATATSNSQINLSWTNNATDNVGIDHWEVYRSTSLGGTYTKVGSNLTSGSSSYNDTSGLNSGTTYYYKIRVYDAAGNYTESNIANATTQSIVDTTNPSWPGNNTLAATAVSSNQINLSWTNNATDDVGVDHWEVYRSTSSGGTYTKVSSNLSPATNTYNDASGLSATTTYYYKVRVYDAAGNYTESIIANATTKLTDVAPPTFSIGYYSDIDLTNTLPIYNGKPITKATTIYLKITASEALNGPPTVNVIAPGTANDITGGTTNLVSGNTYKYTWTVKSGSGVDGDASITITGSDTTGNTASNVTPSGGNIIAIDTTITVPVLSNPTPGEGYAYLTWSTSDTDLKQFKIYREVNTSNTFTPNDTSNLRDTLAKGMTKYYDGTATYPDTYYYRIISVDYAGNISLASVAVNGVVPQKLNPHGSYTSDTSKCGACHNTHSSNGTEILDQADPVFGCYVCHDAAGQSDFDVESEFTSTSHHKIPEGTQSCMDCHNPHLSATDVKRLLSTSSGATSGNAVCFTCHGTAVAVLDDHETNYPQAGSGHNNASFTINSITPFNPVSGTGIACAGCHDEHGSAIVRLLKKDPNGDGTFVNSKDKNFCYECHANAMSGSDSAWNGKAVNDNNSGHTDNCYSCHNSHGTINDNYLVRTYDINYSASRTKAFNGADFETCGIASGCHSNLMDITTPSNQGFYNANGSDNERKNLHYFHLNLDALRGKGNAVCKECHRPHGAIASEQTPGNTATHRVGFPATTVIASPSSSKGPLYTHDPGGSNGGSCTLSCHGTDHNSFSYDATGSTGGSGGESAGRQSCETCHQEIVDSLLATTTTNYRHFITDANADYAGTTGNNCLSFCHVDHDIFSPNITPGANRAENLRTAGGKTTTAPTTGTSTDFNVSGGGACLSCHQTAQNDTAYTQPNGRTGTNALDTANFGNSAHNYATAVTYGSGAYTFNANCAKCHNDNMTKSRQDGSDATKKIATHGSPSPYMLAYFDFVALPAPYEEQFCYKCHRTAGEYYGTAGKTPPDIQGAINKTYRHPVGDTAPDNADNGTSRETECSSCHNTHKTQKAPLNGPAITGVLKGVTGVNVTSWPAAPIDTYTSPTLAQYQVVDDDPNTPAPQITEEWQVCLRCHSNYDSNITASDNKNLAQFMNPNNLSTHGLIAQTKTTNLRSNRQTLMVAGTRWASEPNGSSPMRTTCNDCHGNGNADGTINTAAKGPHGSNWQYIMKKDPKKMDFCRMCHNAPGSAPSLGAAAHSNNNHISSGPKGNLSSNFIAYFGDNNCRICHFGGLNPESTTVADKISAHGNNANIPKTGTAPSNTVPALNGFYIDQAAGGTCYTSPNCNHNRTAKGY